MEMFIQKFLRCLSILFAISVEISFAQPGSIDPSFNTLDAVQQYEGTYGILNSIIQPDEKVIICGNFPAYNGIPRNKIARLNSDGTLDTSFDAGMGSTTNDIGVCALQPDGKIVIAGSFTIFNGVNRKYIARLNTDGSLDTSFDPGAGPNNPILSVAIQPDGKIIVAGTFIDYGGISRSRVARLNSNGTLDTSFNPGTGANNSVYSVIPQPDGKIIIGGSFTSYNGVTVNRIVRLNNDGTRDNTFNPGTGADDAISAIAIQTDGKIVIGGYFYNYNGTTRSRIARLNSNGALDTSFPDHAFGAAGYVRDIKVQPDGRILAVGAFTLSPKKSLVRLYTSGYLDTSFGYNVDSGIIYSVNLQSDGKIIIGGGFQLYNDVGKHGIARLLSDGAIDDSFNITSAGANGSVQKVLTQPDGKILICGAFSTYNGVIRKGIARCNSDGTIDTSFNPGAGANGSIYTALIQPDGKIIIGGAFTNYDGVTRNRIARLNGDGTLDVSFNPGTGPNRGVRKIVAQGNKLVIGGDFDNYNGVTRRYIARLHDNGDLDTSFMANEIGFNNAVLALAIQPTDNKIIVGGHFNYYNITYSDYYTANRIVRLNSDGTLDLSFYSIGPNKGADDYVTSVVIESDGRILIGGAFIRYNGDVSHRIARLAVNGYGDPSFNSGVYPYAHFVSDIILQEDKAIICGDMFQYDGYARDHIARIKLNEGYAGRLDPTFDPGTGPDNLIRTLSLHTDGNIIIGGDFKLYNGIPKTRLARILAKTNQSITFESLPTITYGDPPIMLNATASSGLSVTYTSSDPSVATISGNILNIVGAGNVVITAQQLGNANYHAVNVSQTVIVNKATLTATADSKSKIYGDANPALTISYSGFVGTDNATVIDSPPTISTTALQFSNSGSYPITLNGGLDNNYYIVLVNGSLTINKAPLNITADNKIKTYGDVNPSLTLTYSGFKGTDNASVIDAIPGVSTTALQFSNVGLYPITLSAGSDNNYDLILANGTLTVNKAMLTVTLASKTKIYGDVNPVFTFTYTGFKGTDGVGVIDSPPVGVTAATQYSDVGAYPITLSGGSDNNYGFNGINGNLTITKATLTATAQNKSKIYGDVMPALTFTYSGFKGTDNAAVVDSPPVPATAATDFSNVGTYPITLGTGTDNNYTIVRNNGVLTVNTATLTATAQSKSKIYGDVNPTLTITYTGFKGTDDVSVIDSPPVASTNAVTFSNVGSYPITLSTASDNNYNFAIVDGTLTITKASLTAKADNATRVYGDVNPAFTISYTGFKGTDDPGVIDSRPIAGTTATQPSDAGTYTISVSGGLDNNYSIVYSNGILTITKASQVVTFSPVSPLCVGATLGLTATSTSGLPVSYISANTVIASVSGNVLTANASGTVAITASQAGNINFNPAVNVSQNLSVNAYATLTVDAKSVCLGNTVALTATPAGGTWSGTGVTGSNFNSSGLTAGNYTVTYTYTTTSGCTNNKTGTVTVNVKPTILSFSGPGPVCPGNVYSFSVTLQGGNYSAYTYAWTKPANWTVNSQSLNTISYYVPSSNPGYGGVQVTVTRNGCSVTDGRTAYPCSSGFAMQSPAEESIEQSENIEPEITVTEPSVYPNPASSQFTVHLPESKEHDHRVSVYSQLGTTVFDSVLPKGINKKIISTSTIPAGVYFVCVRDNKGQIILHNRIVIANED
jgi:uncharacterized delta-60 repeat protein